MTEQKRVYDVRHQAWYFELWTFTNISGIEMNLFLKCQAWRAHDFDPAQFWTQSFDTLYFLVCVPFKSTLILTLGLCTFLISGK